MKTYDEMLKEKFKDIKILLVKHDDSPTGLPCYIECYLGAKQKSPEATVLDLGNYIYRTTGLRYQMTPEYRGKGKNTTLRWFMSWEDVAPILDNIKKAFDKQDIKAQWLPIEFQSLIIQDSSRNVLPKGEHS